MAALLLANGQYDGSQLIEKAALEQAHVPAIVRGVDPKTGDASFYGLGWNVDYREHGVEWSHAGAFSAGARTLVHLIPGEQLGIVVLSNAFPTGVPEESPRPSSTGLRRRPGAGLGGPRQRGLRGRLQGDDEAEPGLCDAAGLARTGNAGIRLCRRISQRLCRRRQGRGHRRRPVPGHRPRATGASRSHTSTATCSSTPPLRI